MNRKLGLFVGVAVAVFSLAVSTRPADAQYVGGGTYGGPPWSGYGNPPMSSACGAAACGTGRCGSACGTSYSYGGYCGTPTVGCCGVGNCGMGCGLFGFRQCCNSCCYAPVMGVASYNAIANGACLNYGCGPGGMFPCNGCNGARQCGYRRGCTSRCLQSTCYSNMTSCCAPVATCCGVQAPMTAPAAQPAPAPQPTPDAAPAPAAATAPTPEPAPEPAPKPAA